MNNGFTSDARMYKLKLRIRRIDQHKKQKRFLCVQYFAVFNKKLSHYCYMITAYFFGPVYPAALAGRDE